MSKIDTKRCFVISPIGPEDSEIRVHADDVFECIVEPALEKCDITGVRSDHMKEPGRITSQMIQAILQYDLCIAILTGHNPNVFYELAVAQAARRPVILLNMKGEEIPFDVQDYRVIEYDLKPKNILKGVWVEKLVAQLESVLSKHYEPPGLLDTQDFNPHYKFVFYSPTLKSNPFFHEILDHIVEITSGEDKKIDVIVRKAVTSIDYHMTSDHLRVMEEFMQKDYENTVVIMIPASPSSYDDIFNMDPDSKINLITLDMEIESDDERLSRCSFLKQVINIDNQHGAEIAAKAALDYCHDAGLHEMNIMTCEGEFHARGKFFRDYLEEHKSNIKIHYLDKLKKLSFSKPATASKHVISTLTSKMGLLKDRATFIFCANDNLAIGARVALTSPQLNLDENIDIKIIGFDASDYIRKFIELEDRFIFSSVDQKYYEYARHAVKIARDILEGRPLDSKMTLIKPRIYNKTT